MASKVRAYLTQDLSYDEKVSYFEYITGDEDSTEWIPKVSDRRDKLIYMELKCTCGKYINFRETGVCKCSSGHKCYNIVLEAIDKN